MDLLDRLQNLLAISENLIDMAGVPEPVRPGNIQSHLQAIGDDLAKLGKEIMASGADAT